jgi:hypothetical protein
MRMLWIALVLGHAFTAVAQPVIGPEVLSDALPYTYRGYSVAVPPVAMAKDSSGVVIAWSMVNGQGAWRIYVARLDATGHIAGEVHTMPVLSTIPADAELSSLAALPGGGGFVAAWTELSLTPFQSQVVYCRLDRALNASSLTPLATFPEAIVPAVVRSGTSTTWIAAGSQVWRLNPDGSPQPPLNTGFAADDMTVANDFPHLVVGQASKESIACLPDCAGASRWVCPESCRVYQYTYTLRFLALYTTAGAISFKYQTDAQPAVQSDGHDVLVAWFDGTQPIGGAVFAARMPPQSDLFPERVAQPLFLGNFGRESGATRPDIATDGERYVVVWRTTPDGGGGHDIAGAVIDRDGKITPLTIATSSADERDPSVIFVGGGTFLVAYETYTAGVRRIGGRFVTFPSHRRPVN